MQMDDCLTKIDEMPFVVKLAWERLRAAEAELADARLELIELHNRESAKRRTRPSLRLLEGGGRPQRREA